MEKKKKISLKIRIVGALIVGLLLLAIMLGVCLVPTVSSDIKENNKNYMLDLVKAYGDHLNYSVQTATEKSSILNADTLGNMLEDVHLQGVDSSYAYVVAKDKTMLYHPSKDDIGTKIDNEVVLNIISQIEGGTIPNPSVSTYTRNGTTKYISYFPLQDGSAILCIVADENDILSDLHAVTYKVVGVGVIVVIILSLIGYFMVGRMIQPITVVTQSINKMSKLDFTDDEDLNKIMKNKDETGVMGTALVNMKNEIVTMVSGIKEQSDIIYNSAAELDANAVKTSEAFGSIESAVNDIAQGATSQANETQQATNHIVTIGNMIDDTQQQVEVVNESSTSIDVAKEKAVEAIKLLNEVNKSTIESIDVITRQTNETNASAMQIEDAAIFIASIAEETNLLSLNASIEAARAGEAGRGFAVVASQIQKLAEQSNESASKIDEIVKSLISNSQQAVNTMAEVQDIIRRQSDYIVTTENAFVDVNNGVESSVSGLEIIADKVETLGKSRVEIVDAVQNLTAIAEENAASTEETSATATQVSSIMHEVSEYAKQLNDVASALDEKMNDFVI